MNLEEWLSSIGLSEYAECFRKNHINLEMARSMSSSDLQEIGITSFGHRKILLERLAQEEEPPPPESTPTEAAPIEVELQQPKGGLWFHPQGGIAYIPEGADNAPMVVLSRFARTVAIYNQQIAGWILKHLPADRKSPEAMALFWKDLSTIMITWGGWIIAWKGLIYTAGLTVEQVATALNACRQGYRDLAWPADAIVTIVDVHDAVPEVQLTWGELIQASKEAPPEPKSEPTLEGEGDAEP